MATRVLTRGWRALGHGAREFTRPGWAPPAFAAAGVLRRGFAASARAPKLSLAERIREAARDIADVDRPLSKRALPSARRGSAVRRSAVARVIQHKLLAEATSLTQLLRLVSARGAAFDSINEITALSRIAKEAEHVPGLDFAALEEHEAAQSLLGRIEARLLRNGYDGRSLATGAYALARLHFGHHRRSARVWRLLAERAEQRLPTFDAQNLSNTAWAFARANLAARPSATAALFCAIAPAAEARASEFTPQGLANVAWALSLCADVRPFAGAVIALSARVLETPPAAPVGAEEGGRLDEQRVAHSVASALLTLSLALPADAPDPTAARARELLARARARLEEVAEEQPITSSRSHLELSKALRGAGWAHSCEVKLEGGLLLLDMACEESRTAVEFDGPFHYRRHALSRRGRARARAAPPAPSAPSELSRAEAESYDGKTRRKDRVLAELGWRVFRVGWREWEALDGDAERKRAFAEELVTRIRAPPDEAAEGAGEGRRSAADARVIRRYEYSEP